MTLMSMGYNHKHKSDFYCKKTEYNDIWMFLIVKSPAVFIIDSVEYDVKPNSVVLFSDKSDYSYYASSKIYCDDWLNFIPDEETLQMFYNLGIPSDKPVHFSSVNDISAIVSNMCMEFYSDNIFRFNIAFHLFQVLFFKLAEKLRSPDEHNPKQYLNMFSWANINENINNFSADSFQLSTLLSIRNEIFTWPGKNWSVDDMAKELSVGRSRFQHLYKQTFGTNVTQDIASSRIKAASIRLTESDDTIRDIAAGVGYSSSSHMAKQFIEYLGVSPSQFRKNNK